MDPLSFRVPSTSQEQQSKANAFFSNYFANHPQQENSIQSPLASQNTQQQHSIPTTDLSNVLNSVLKDHKGYPKL